MKTIYYLAYKLLRVIHGLAFGVAYKSQNLSYRMLDRAGGRRRNARPLNAIYHFIKNNK
jgi:hypothetical protein